MSLERVYLFPGGHIPHLNRLVITAAGDPPAVWAECHAVDRDHVSVERECLVTHRRVPHLDCAVSPAAGDPPAVLAERHAVDDRCMPVERRLVSVEQREEIIVLPTTQVPLAAIQHVACVCHIANVPFVLHEDELAGIEQPFGARFPRVREFLGGFLLGDGIP